MNEIFLISVIAVTIRAGTSLLYSTLGEIITQRSGVVNMGVEGMMMMGAVTGFAAAYHSHSVWVGLAAAMLVGGLMATVHAVLTITLRAEQVVAGIALTLFGTGLANYLGQRLGPNGTPLITVSTPTLQKIALPGLSAIPFIGKAVFTQDAVTYGMYILVPVAWYWFYRTRQGLHMRAVGENPQTSDAMGVNVTANRYFYTIVGGIMSGIAGAHLSLGYTPTWTDGFTAGRGWIAVALVIFATWDPLRAFLGAVLFGGVSAIQFRLQAMGTTIPSQILSMMPYVLTIFVLVVITWWDAFSKRLGAPAGLGIPYVREEKR